MLSRHSVGSYPGYKLTHSSSGNTQPQLSQLTEPLWTYPGLKSGIGMCELISTSEEEKQRQGMTSPKLLASEEKLQEKMITVLNFRSPLSQ